MTWLLVCAFFFPTPAMTAAADANEHVLRRLNGPERQAAIAEAARQDAAAPAERGNPETSRPQSVTEVLFNYGASFMGVPGLAPQRDIYGNPDEGLGFHQDGTVRRAGGTAPGPGPSSNGGRAGAYMRSGLQNGYGQNGMLEPGYDPVTGFNFRVGDPAAGGRISGRSGYFRDMSDFDPMSMAMDRGLSYGAGFLNSLGEAGISSLVDDGRARLNFYLDRDGHFSGEGDVLLPFYDSARTTIYAQLGARSMHDSSDTRWIGNAGLGQRWFPLANGDSFDSGDGDAGMLMLGYNAFFDYDLTRDHQRGGIGVEVWYDWLRLASNYYFPLSGWKGSEDFDSAFVKERPAKGWDARVKAYLPFYRNVALTGAYSQWFGDHVGMFGASDLEKDPRVWSYGIEYTPVPLVSGFITQRSTERGRTDTEFGLTLTYHFQMPWEQQISHSKVAELRTVSGSRHEFVDRENRIILEYKAKNSYHIEYVGPDGARGFLFRIRDGFGEYKAGQTVRVTADGAYLAQAGADATPTSPTGAQGFFARAVNFLDALITVQAAHAAGLSRTYITDSQGRFWVQLDPVAPDPTLVTIQAGDNSQTFTLAGEGGASISMTLNVAYNRTSFVTSDFSATATITAAAYVNDRPLTINTGDITWTVESSSISAAWWESRAVRAMNGLAWGATPISLTRSESQRTDMSGNGGTAPTGSTAQLTDIVGSRSVVVKAVMTIGGAQYTQTVNVTFGAGPLSVFKSKPEGSMNWETAGERCGSAGDPKTNVYQPDTKLPTQVQLANVSGKSDYAGQQGAAHAAGWQDDGTIYGTFNYWTGESGGSDQVRLVYLNDGVSGFDSAWHSFPVAVCLP